MISTYGTWEFYIFSFYIFNVTGVPFFDAIYIYIYEYSFRFLTNTKSTSRLLNRWNWNDMILFSRKTNRTEECIRMLQKCVSLDPAYTPAYLVLARLATGPTAGALLRHVVRLQPRSPDHLTEYASWLYQNGKWQWWNG